MRILIFIIVFLASFPISSEPQISTEFDFYNIYPYFNKDIEREIHERTPIVKDGLKYNGHTHWHVSWTFKWKKINGRCQISEVNTFLTVKYTMPRIPDDHLVNTEVQHSFNEYYDSLFNHEQGHRDSGLFAARDIEKSLASLGLFKDCNSLETKANMISEKIIQKYNNRDRDYDKKTNHGRF